MIAAHHQKQDVKSNVSENLAPPQHPQQSNSVFSGNVRRSIAPSWCLTARVPLRPTPGGECITSPSPSPLASASSIATSPLESCATDAKSAAASDSGARADVDLDYTPGANNGEEAGHRKPISEGEWVMVYDKSRRQVHRSRILSKQPQHQSL